MAVQDKIDSAVQSFAFASMAGSAFNKDVAQANQTVNDAVLKAEGYKPEDIERYNTVKTLNLRPEGEGADIIGGPNGDEQFSNLDKRIEDFRSNSPILDKVKNPFSVKGTKLRNNLLGTDSDKLANALNPSRLTSDQAKARSDQALNDSRRSAEINKQGLNLMLKGRVMTPEEIKLSQGIRTKGGNQ